MPFNPNFWTTHIGSVPHTEASAISEWLAENLDIPAWVQLPRRTFRENMYTQYSVHLPAVEIDEAGEKVFFNIDDDRLTSSLERFYEQILDDNVDAFALDPCFSSGFSVLQNCSGFTSGEWIKGQVTGPISFGLTVTDQNLRASLYHDLLAEVIVMNMAMIARWQVRQLRTLRPQVMIFVDEPYMASFGSAFINLEREQAVKMLNDVFSAIHREGALAGVHCCGNTDWSVLLETEVDILSLDSYGYVENLALYPAELRTFLDRGGVIAWGIVPNNETIFTHTPEALSLRLHADLKLISEKAAARGLDIPTAELAAHSLITPACGLGSAAIPVSEQVFKTLTLTGELLRQG
ncbi:MAG TPA: hypothetical protein VJZ27_16495 [Aggregatilineales bacterium]|nr:hypothetical protein [Aggregatilineales bacterium]